MKTWRCVLPSGLIFQGSGRRVKKPGVVATSPDLQDILLREIGEDKEEEFEAIVEDAVALARSAQARALPGYFLATSS